MNSRYAQLLTQRFNMLDLGERSATRRCLISSIYPQISRAAYSGLTQIHLTYKVDDEVATALEALDYVVRRGPPLITTCISWGPQTIIDEHGREHKVSPNTYNDIIRNRQSHFAL